MLNKKLQEDYIYDKAVYSVPIKKLPKNTQHLARYAFTEMLNNAIEHSNSKYIDISLTIGDSALSFDIIDRGVGIFRHVQKKFKLLDEYEALRLADYEGMSQVYFLLQKQPMCS